MSLEALKQKLNQGSISGVILLCGADEYTKNYYANEIKKKFDKNTTGVNYFVFDGSKNSPQELVQLTEGFPLLLTTTRETNTKLIEIKNLTPDNINESIAEEYSAIFAQIPEFCTLLIIYSAEELDIKKLSPTMTKKKKAKGLPAFLEAIKNNGLIIEFETPSADRLISWAARHFKSYGTPITKAELEYLLEFCGTDMNVLATEINKLSMYCGERGISRADIENVCCPNTEYQVFDMTKALVEGNDKKAFKILDALKFAKTEPILLLGILARLISDMAIIKSGADSKLNFAQIANASSINEWQVKRYLDFLRNKDGDFLPFAASECLEADKKLKSSPEEPYIVFETLVARISAYGK